MWLPVVYCLGYAAANMFLWSLPLADLVLFLITAPFSIAYFWGVFRLYRGA